MLQTAYQMKNMRLFYTAFLFIVFSFTGNRCDAQRLDSLLNDLSTKYPQEKIYIQYDKPYYNPGETIWFKAYLTYDGSALPASKTVYAELIDEKGTVLQKKIMPVIESGAASYFDLPDSLQKNTLFVRAYTSWMLNFDSSLLYLKPVSIISNAKKIVKPASYSVTFFPEGGDLVNGVESRIAFKATDQDGNPFYVSGYLSDKQGNKLLSFGSVHNGMGTFSFTPLIKETYKLFWKDKKGAMHESPLPEIKEQGVVLKVTNTNNQINYYLQRPDSVSESFKSYYVIAQAQQQAIYSAVINMKTKTSVTAPLPVDSLLNGIVQITVFNADRIPVAERIVFINHDNYYFNTDLHAVELNLNKRKHNTLQVDVGGSIVSNLSIAVTDESLSTPSSNRENIFSSLLLTSDLKGYVYNPAYYFSAAEDSVAQQLDLVMLTNGWRRFKWEELLAGKWPALNHLPENYLTISGNVYGPASFLLKGKEVSVILKAKAGAEDIFTIPVSPDGKFFRNGIYFFDTAKVYYQFNNDKNKQLTSTTTFSFNNSFVKTLPPSAAVLNNFYLTGQPDSIISVKNKRLTKLLEQDFFEGNKIKSLEGVTLKSHTKTAQERIDEKYTSGFFTGGDAYIFSVADDPFSKGSLTVLNYLQGKVAGLQISTTGTPSATWRGGSPSIFLNESPADLEMIQSINMNDVALIKIFRPPFIGAANGGSGGAIAVYMKKGEQASVTAKGLDFVRLNGYSSIKEFYSPDYDKVMDIVPANDLRSTLYWNPFLIMDKNTRRIKVPFFNSDNCKKIRVVIEGINSEGQLTREEKVFE
jgi:hypothetical protein